MAPLLRPVPEQNIDLLLLVLEIFRDAADYLAQEDCSSELDLKRFYLVLVLRCYQFLDLTGLVLMQQSNPLPIKSWTASNPW
jgi:hypothetical protein